VTHSLDVEGDGEYVLEVELPAGSERVWIFEEIPGNCATVSVTVEGPGSARIHVLEC
jgi:hypothetical protein